MTDKQIITEDDFVNAKDFCPYLQCETDCYEAVTCQWFVDTLRQLKRAEQRIVELNKTIKVKEQECENNKIAYQMELDIYNQACLDLQEELKAKEQECEELKIYIESNEQQVKEVETLVMDNDRLINELDQLKAENERLVIENENLSENNEILNGINRNLEYMLDDVIAKVLTDEQEEYFYTELKEKFTTKLDEIIKDNNQYKQAIEKIKEIAEECYYKCNSMNNCNISCKYYNDCNGEFSYLLAYLNKQICDEVNDER